MTVRIATYNVRKGGRRRRSSLTAVLRALDPDLTVLQEATDPMVVRDLAEATRSVVSMSGPGRSVAVLSRFPVTSSRWHPLPTGRAFAEVGYSTLGIRILAVHLSAGLSARGERRRAVELDRVLDVAARPPGPARTVIVGDLNAIAPSDVVTARSLPAWIRLMLRVDGGISTTVIRRVLADGFVDAFRLLNPNDPGATLPAAAPTVRLDYLMIGRALVPAALACWIGRAEGTTLAAASDHLPVVLALELE